MKIIDKYIVKEMAGPFIFGLGTFTILFFAGGQLFMVTKMIAESLVSFKTAIGYALDGLPAILVFTLPMAVLLSVLLAFGRLSGESELIAMKAGGISFFRMAIPALVTTFCISLVSFYIQNYIAPDSTYRANNTFINAFLKKEEGFSENMIIRDTEEDGQDRVIYSQKFIPGKNLMQRVFIHYFDQGKLVRTVYSDTVYYRPKEGKWYLIDATTQDFDENQEPTYISKNKEIYLPLEKTPDQLAGRDRRREEMNRQTLRQYLDDMASDGFKDEAELKKYYDYEIGYHQIIAVPFTCFVFGMFGIPLAIRPHRTSKAFGLGLSIVFIFAYYVLMSTGMVMGQNGKIDTLLAAWLPNMVFALAGLILIVRKAQE